MHAETMAFKTQILRDAQKLGRDPLSYALDLLVASTNRIMDLEDQIEELKQHVQPENHEGKIGQVAGQSECG